MTNEKKPPEVVEDILENARNSAQLNMQSIGKLHRAGEPESLIEQCHNKPSINPKIMDMLSEKFKGGFRRGETVVISAFNNRMHPAYVGIGAVESHEEAMDKLEAAGKAFPSGYMWYRDEKTGREFPLPALSSGKSAFFQSIVMGNPHLMNIYTHATVQSLEETSFPDLSSFLSSNIAARKETKERLIKERQGVDDGVPIRADFGAAFPKLTHFAVGNGGVPNHTFVASPYGPTERAMIAHGSKLTDLHGGMGVICPVLPRDEPAAEWLDVSLDPKRVLAALEDVKIGKMPSFNIDSCGGDFERFSDINEPALGGGLILQGSQKRSKKPKRHGDKQSTNTVKVRPSGLLKAFMKKVGA